MIPEAQQEQAALYALGLLDADEANGFEREMEGDAELRELVRDCQEASAGLAAAAAAELGGPPAELKGRIMASLPVGARGGTFEVVRPAAGPLPVAPVPVPAVAGEPPRRGGVIVPFFIAAVPWAIAALLTVSCALMAQKQARLQDENSALNTALDKDRDAVATATGAEPLAKVAFCPLGPTSPTAPAEPLAVVAWDAQRQSGVVRIIQLTPPASGKDYQLWAVEAGRKEPVSAGLVKVDAAGTVTMPFKPVATDKDGPVQAFALSLEQAGGSPTNAGPILLLGKL